MTQTTVPPPIADGRQAGGFSAENLFRFHPVPMWIYDRETLAFLDVNEAAVAVYGYSRDDFLRMTIRDIRPAEDIDRLESERRRKKPAFAPGLSKGWRHVTRHGDIIWVDIRSRVVDWRGREAVLVSAFDITERREAEDALRLQTAYFRQLFENSPEGIVILDRDDRIVDANPGFTALFGYSRDELLGRKINDTIVPEGAAREATDLSNTVLGDEWVEHETRRIRKDGSHVDVAILGYPIDIDREQIGVYGIYRDITERKRLTGLMAYQASHDSLTDLYNRRELEIRAQEVIDRGYPVSTLLFIDLDQFKVVNDTCGHGAGDQVLRQVAELLSRHVRASDVLARLGGDEFAVLLVGCDADRGKRVAQDLIDAMNAHSFVWEKRAFSLGVSIGVVEIDREMLSLSSLLTAADTAVFSAKELGRNRVHLYRPDDREVTALRGEMSWVSRLNDALRDDRFRLFYQRIEPVGVDDGTPVDHYEILVRMIDEDGRLIPPGAFIPAAERYNIMPSLDRWVVRNVFEELARRRVDENESGDLVCINLSGTTLGSEGFSEFVEEAFARSGIPPASICFEVTETAAITNMRHATAFIDRVRSMGAAIALDDFGSGMSSFSYLKSLHVDYLKIDGSFIREIANNPIDSAMAEAINRVGQVMGIRTVAEFVENADILERLRELGVNYAQGFGVHRPEPWEEGPVAAQGKPGKKADPLGDG